MKRIILFSTLVLYTLVLKATDAIPYVIIVSLDGFRWDYLERNVTPNMQSIITHGVKAESMQPCFPTKTFPNHTSMMTGMYPEHHGIILNDFTDPITHEYYTYSNKETAGKSKWYKGEFFWETARKHHIVTASYFWPVSDMIVASRKPNYYESYNHFTPYQQVLDTLQFWLNLPNEKRPHFITLYFHEADDAGHQYGPDAPQTTLAIKKVDTIIGALIHTINTSPLKDSINLIVVSDHGMTKLDKSKNIPINDYLKNVPHSLEYNSIICFINAKQKEDTKKVYDSLKQYENHFKVYLKKDIPSRLHFNESPLIWDIVAIADIGYSFIRNDNDIPKIHGGNHGYDNAEKDMHAIFIAQGNLFKKHYKIPMISNLQIYPLLCTLFHIPPNKDIDSHLSKEMLSILK